MKSLLIGIVYDAQQPPPFISAVLWTALEERIPSPAGVHFTRIPIREYAEPDPIDLEAGVDWLTRHHKENRVLVACRAGLERSVSLIIAYLCCIKNMSYREAVQFVQARRPGATPLPNLEKTIEKPKVLRGGDSVGPTSTESQEKFRSQLTLPRSHHQSENTEGIQHLNQTFMLQFFQVCKEEKDLEEKSLQAEDRQEKENQEIKEGKRGKDERKE